jgi:hypothetical protein
VLHDLPVESVSMHAEELGGFGLISIGLGERGLYELSLEFVDCFAEVDTPLDHFVHKSFQFLFHNFFLGGDFGLLLLPPAFKRAVANEEFCF